MNIPIRFKEDFSVRKPTHTIYIRFMKHNTNSKSFQIYAGEKYSTQSIKDIAADFFYNYLPQFIDRTIVFENEKIDANTHVVTVFDKEYFRNSARQRKGEVIPKQIGMMKSFCVKFPNMTPQELAHALADYLCHGKHAITDNGEKE